MGFEVMDTDPLRRVELAIEDIRAGKMVILVDDEDLVTPAAPRAIASLGMPKTMQLASSWAKVRAPHCFISSRPRAPSSPMPVMMIPTAFDPALRAAERNSTSTEGRWRETSGPSRTETR